MSQSKPMGFQKAERKLTNPTIAITGPTGSGKTFSGLRLAAGIAKTMGGRFAVIDAENGSASLYSEFFDFDTLNLTPPFTTEKYIEAIALAEKSGYVAVLCDSITHAWAGEGGLLEQKAQLDARPNSNHWTNWNPIKAKDTKFKNAYLHSSVPFFIATMRSKMEYAQTENGGKKKIEKMGMAPVQSDGIEYEFSVVMDVAMNHECEVTKDRTHLFRQTKIFQITEDTGRLLVEWRNSGKKTVVETAPEKSEPQPPKGYDEPPPPTFDDRAEAEIFDAIPTPPPPPPATEKPKERIYNHVPGSITTAQKKAIYEMAAKKNIDPVLYIDPSDISILSEKRATEIWKQLRDEPVRKQN